MAFQIMVDNKASPVVHNVTKQEYEVYALHLRTTEGNYGGDYIPQKITVRRKGKLWVSDVEDYPELVSLLTAEVMGFAAVNE